MSNETRDWFTGDEHHGHALMQGIRGISTIRDMEEMIIENHNAVVGRHDRVFHIGDFAFRCEPKRKKAILEKLNGSHFLCIGNHDDSDTIGSLKWAGPPQHNFLLKSSGERLFLAHYAHRVWPGMHKGALHLYGHSHNRIPADSRSCDVGVDAWGLMPTNVQQIKARLALAPPHVEAEVEPDPENDGGGLTP